jgi:hypothetical protein
VFLARAYIRVVPGTTDEGVPRLRRANTKGKLASSCRKLQKQWSKVSAEVQDSHRAMEADLELVGGVEQLSLAVRCLAGDRNCKKVGWGIGLPYPADIGEPKKCTAAENRLGKQKTWR